MPDGFFNRLKKAWNVFSNRDPTDEILQYTGIGSGYSNRPDKRNSALFGDKSIAGSVFNRIAIDASQINFGHVRTDDQKRYVEDMDSGLQNCLTLEANIDQTARAFIQDIVISMMDEGVVGILPIDTDVDPYDTESYDILSMRTCKILQWYPQHVRVEVFNNEKNMMQQITVPKKEIAIIENPLYSVVNGPNSTLQRLIRKLALLDISDDKNSSNKLDLIIQLPYIIKSDARREQANQRMKDIEDQLTGSKYGVAYTDGTEKITQLNRPVENQLLDQVKMLTEQFFAQTGLTLEILNGTANESTMFNYYDRTIEPICNAIADEFKRKFLTKTARTQGQTIMFFNDPFKLIPLTQMAALVDTLTRNEVMTSNEWRQKLGLKPSSDPNADMLRNKNLYPDEMAGYGYDPNMAQDSSMVQDPNMMQDQSQQQGSILDMPVDQIQLE